MKLSDMQCITTTQDIGYALILALDKHAEFLAIGRVTYAIEMAELIEDCCDQLRPFLERCYDLPAHIKARGNALDRLQQACDELKRFLRKKKA